MDVNSYLSCILLIVGSALAAVAGLLIMRRVINIEKLRPTHEVGGYLLSIVGTLYSVVLGMVVVSAMQHYDSASEIVQRESDNLADVYVLAKRLPPPRREKVQALCKEYANQVLDSEWKKMKCSTYCPLARQEAVGLMDTLMSFEPTTENEKALYPLMVQEASQFWQNRQARIRIASQGLPAAQWVALIAGAFILIAFTYLFGLENVRLQIVMTVLVSVLIALNMVLLLLFAYPFSGDLALTPAPFSSIQEIFMGPQENDKSSLSP